MKANLCYLQPVDAAALNADRLLQLYAQLGDDNADRVVFRAMEELAMRLAHTERLHRRGLTEEMRKSARSIRAIGEQIGMMALCKVADHVADCIDSGDATALAATLARLIRVGEKSLSDIWGMQDLSG